jgi:hypothetical protein
MYACMYTYFYAQLFQRMPGLEGSMDGDFMGLRPVRDV